MGSGTDQGDPITLLHSRPGYLLRRANQVAVATFLEALGDLKITTTQYGALIVIAAREPIDQVGLARLLHLDRSTTGLAVANLERSGLVRRLADPADRRRRMLVMTTGGRAALTLAHQRGEVARLGAMRVFTDGEEKELVRLLQKFIAGWEALEQADLPAG